MLESSSIQMTVKQLFARYKEGNLKFDHPVQRKSGQWSKAQKSLLVHSIIDGYPIPPFYVVKGKGKEGTRGNSYSVLDGQQRLMTIFEFLNDKFMLDKSIPTLKKIMLDVNDFVDYEDLTKEEVIEAKKQHKFSFERADFNENEFLGFDSAGLTASELPEDMYDEFRTRSLSVTLYEDNITNEEIEDMFFRLNNGTPLSKIQQTKAKVGSKLMKELQKLVEHKFITEILSLTPAQRKNEKDLEIIITLLFYLDTLSDDKLKVPSTISSTFISKYAESLKNKDKTRVLQLIDKAKSIFDYLVASLDGMEKDKEMKVLLSKPIHITPVMATAYSALINDQTNDAFGEFLELFSTMLGSEVANKSNENIYVTRYKDFLGQGSTKKVKFTGRIEVMIEAFQYSLTSLIE